MLVNATLGFGDFGPRVEIFLPDENYIREILAKYSAAIADGHQQVLHLLFEGAPAEPFPRHGVIEFGDSCELLNVDGEGPWWLYVRHRLTATDAVLQIFSEVAHIRLTVKS